jgi:hypothetical protein
MTIRRVFEQMIEFIGLCTTCYNSSHITIFDRTLSTSDHTSLLHYSVVLLHFSSDLRLTTFLSLSLSLMSRPTVSRPVCLGIKHPSGAYDQIFISVLTVASLLMWGALSDKRTGLSFTIAADPRQRSHYRVRVPWDLDHILLSQIRDFPFRRRLLQLAGLRWRYSTPPPHEINI